MTAFWIVFILFCAVMMVPARYDPAILLADWLESRRAPKPPETFTCEGCGSGPWDISWDPPEQPIMGGRGGRFCPNCSGAD